jgi:hypothetical protein
LEDFSQSSRNAATESPVEDAETDPRR